MAKDKLEEKHNCDILVCYHNNTKGLCCLYNPDNCKYRQLQKENAELKKSCDETQELLDKQIEATYKLDKENAELKEHHKNVCENLTNTHRNIREQLTKAKELLNMFLRLHYNPIVDEHTLFCKVEQFLNSEVEK